MTKFSTRILAFDLLRGYLLCVIAIDHLYRFPSLWDSFTGQGKLWVSAAEGFFIISGLLIGLLKQSPQKIFRRAIKLYCWSVSLTLLFTWWGSLFTTHALKSGIWSGPSSDLVVRLITLRYVYGWADFLPYYVIFLFISPLVLLALKRGKVWLILFLTFFCWLIRGQNFYMAWQILFFTGLVAGYHFNKIKLFLSRLSPLLFVVTVISIAVSSYFVFSKNLSLPVFDKATLGAGRLFLSLIWFSTFFLVFHRFENIIDKLTFGFFHLLGKNSLFVYGLQAVVLFPITSWLPSKPDYWLNTLYAASVLLFIYLITRANVYYSNFRIKLSFIYHPLIQKHPTI